MELVITFMIHQIYQFTESIVPFVTLFNRPAYIRYFNQITKLMTELGQLKLVQLRTRWVNEAYDFTPWLANNIEILNEAIGLELEVENTEVKVGPYSADILAKDTGTGRYVVIENQLEKTNHDHLGKAITYASALDASSIIWLASDFTDEHKKALDWLNDHTSDQLGFYGIKIELWQIDSSKPAIKLNVKSQPNIAARQAAKGVEELSETKKTQLEYWNQFRDLLAETKKIPSIQTPRAQYWFDVSLGKAYITLSNIYSPTENKVGVRVYIGNRLQGMYDYLLNMREEIEIELGEKLVWNPNPENQDKVILLTRDVNLQNNNEWVDSINWLVHKTVQFRKTFSRRVKAFGKSQTSL